jgi:hypothetical protein
VADYKDFISTYGLVPRDRVDLLDLPLNFRWEFTRRHPYYLLVWRMARGYRRNEFAIGSSEVEAGLAAMYLLGMIGVTGEPPDPTCSFEDLGDLDPAFMSGSIQPMTIRNMISILIETLPSADLQLVRAALAVAVDPDYAIPDDIDQRLQKRKADSYLMRFSSAVFDSYPDAPLYYIHLDASQRRIVEDVEVFIRRWKEQRNIPERRTRIQEFVDYLKVWDLHEGWSEGGYKVEEEKSFGQIAKELRLPKSTVVNAYRAAFKRLVGQEFAPELWIRVMGLVKLPALNSQPASKLTGRYRRLISSNAPKPVPESRVENEPPEHGEVGLIESESAHEGDQKFVELALDATELIERGLADSEIAEKLELNDRSVLRYLRGLVEME